MCRCSRRNMGPVTFFRRSAADIATFDAARPQKTKPSLVIYVHDLFSPNCRHCSWGSSIALKHSVSKETRKQSSTEETTAARGACGKRWRGGQAQLLGFVFVFVILGLHLNRPFSPSAHFTSSLSTRDRTCTGMLGEEGSGGGARNNRSAASSNTRECHAFLK